MTARFGNETDGQLVQGIGRLTAKLAHSQEVRRVKHVDETRARVKTTNNGIGIRELRTIRKYGWKVVAVSPRHNVVTLKRGDAHAR